MRLGLDSTRICRYSDDIQLRPHSGAGDCLRVPGVVSLGLRDPGPAHQCQHLNQQSHHVGILLVLDLFGA